MRFAGDLVWTKNDYYWSLLHMSRLSGLQWIQNQNFSWHLCWSHWFGFIVCSHSFACLNLPHSSWAHLFKPRLCRFAINQFTKHIIEMYIKKGHYIFISFTINQLVCQDMPVDRWPVSVYLVRICIQSSESPGNSQLSQKCSEKIGLFSGCCHVS
jgi:hypothetical protein